jgi:hypothetical protein
VVGPTQEVNYFLIRKPAHELYFLLTLQEKLICGIKKIWQKKMTWSKKKNCKREESGIMKPMYSPPIKAASLDG